jgi:DNA polymerase
MANQEERDEQAWAARQLGDRLEALRRAGIDRIPKASGRRLVTGISKVTNGVDSTVRSGTTPPALPLSTCQNTETVRAASTCEPELAVLASQVAGCTRCEALASTRTQTVFGEGDPHARLMFIGEAPGADEDRTGRPFVGRAGRLLEDMITKGMGLRREDVYIANILKCRPPDNRVPALDEVANCAGFLNAQIERIGPEFLCLLGKTAASSLLKTTQTMGNLRGRWFTYQGIQTLVTYHPSYLLRVPSSKRDAWEDLKILMASMGLPLPTRGD